MAKKKEVATTRKITAFFAKKPSPSPGLSIATSNQTKAKGLADNTNLKYNERHQSIQAANGHLSQNRNVVRTNPKSSNSLKPNLTKNNQTIDMTEDTTTLENDGGKLVVVGESRKRKFENDSDDLDTISVIEIDDEEIASIRPVLPARGRAMFTNQVVQLSDSGELKVDGVVKSQWDEETMNLVREKGFDTSKILVHRRGYLIVNGELLHRVLASTKLENDFEDFLKEGFGGNIEDLNAVAHLDDDKWNCNISNLLNVPEAWNYNLKKVKDAKPVGKNWLCQLVIAGSKTYNTKTVSTKEDALVQYDILKVLHCVDNVKQSPLIAQRLIFQYGLVRPSKYVILGWYKDIATLVSHAGDWTKSQSGRKKGSAEKNKRQRFERVPLEDASQPIKDALNAPGNAPFDPEQHVIFAYIGKKKLADGSLLRHERIVNKDFYEDVVLSYEGGVGVDADGYLMFTDLGMMHNLALGRSRGDYKQDGLQGCHGKGGILDNRVITLEGSTLDGRTLTLGSASVNASHINRTRASTVSTYPCVYPTGQNWFSQVQFDGVKYYLGTFTTEVEAANAYACVQASRRDLEKTLARVLKDAGEDVKKTIRASNLPIVKSFINFDGNGKVEPHSNV